MTPDHMSPQDLVNEFMWTWTRHHGKVTVAARIFGMSPAAFAQRLHRLKRSGVDVTFNDDTWKKA